MKILVLGGTRFVGKSLVYELLKEEHEVTLFTRGNNPIPSGVEHIKGDRELLDSLEILKDKTYDILVDTSGRTKEQTEKVVSLIGRPTNRVIYISSAGVYDYSSYWPLDENSPIDENSRHYGKYKTEQFLINERIPFTSFRPTYIYGPGNYNPIEKWFFDRINFNQPIPLPGKGEIITQLGHVNDLSKAIVTSLKYDISINKIYNCSGKKGVTFRGLVFACADVLGVKHENLDIRSFDPALLNPKERKLFPLRLNNFITDINLIEEDIDWSPSIHLEDGLLDSYDNDYKIRKYPRPDFSIDTPLID
tara:strand:- start:608 stop:1525 length:918 start_codon:yes stop_codon:yes gene_type:complete